MKIILADLAETEMLVSAKLLKDLSFCQIVIVIEKSFIYGWNALFIC